jgi:hypothetical protein
MIPKVIVHVFEFIVVSVLCNVMHKISFVTNHNAHDLHCDEIEHLCSKR